MKKKETNENSPHWKNRHNPFFELKGNTEDQLSLKHQHQRRTVNYFTNLVAIVIKDTIVEEHKRNYNKQHVAKI